MFLSDCHSDANGQPSWTRVAASYSLIIASILTLYQMGTGTDLTNLIITWLGTAFGGKVVSKGLETQAKKEKTKRVVKDDPK